MSHQFVNWGDVNCNFIFHSKQFLLVSKHFPGIFGQSKLPPTCCVRILKPHCLLQFCRKSEVKVTLSLVDPRLGKSHVLFGWTSVSAL